MSQAFATPECGEVQALDDVSLDVSDGSFIVLLGPSGCGKTTLLRCIAGLETPDSGEIRLRGERIDHVPVWKRRVNTVFQSYALFPHMTVAQNIAVTRQMTEGDFREAWVPGERLTVEQALAACTSGVSFQAHDDRGGVLRPGARSDVVLLARDPRAVSPLEIESIAVVGTWCDGQRVHGA